MNVWLKRWWGMGLLVAVLAMGLAMALRGTAFVQRLELVAYDVALRTARADRGKSEDIVIVAIDDDTFEKVSHNEELQRRLAKWPWPRSVWALLIDYLKARGAKAAVFDMTWDVTDEDEANDREIFKAIQRTQLPVYVGFTATPLRADDRGKAGICLPRVEHPVNRRRVDTAVEDPPPPLDFVGQYLDLARSPGELATALAFPLRADGVTLAPLSSERGAALRPRPPINRVIATAQGFGLVLPEADTDGILRRTRFAYRDVCAANGEGNAYVTLSVAAASDLLGADEVMLSPGRLHIGGRTLLINRDGSAGLDYGGTLQERFGTLSLGFVLDDIQRLKDGRPSALPTVFKDKVVVVGGFAASLNDMKSTPFEHTTPGVTKHVTELDALLSGTFIREAAPWVSVVLGGFLSLFVAFTLLRARATWVQGGSVPVAFALLATVAYVFMRDAQHVHTVTPALGVAFSIAGALITKFVFADRERQRMQLMFSRYVSPVVVDQLAAQEQLPRLDGENREVSAFFSDIRKFSTFSEKFRDDPKTLVRLLNTYLTRVSGALLRHQGTLDKYIGDAVVCIFGAPLTQADHAVRACRAALEVQREVAALRAEYVAQGLPDVYTRIGVNSATMFVGNFGSEQLFNYTAMGDGMNLASRLEGANKAYETLIMIGPRTHQLAQDFIEARELDRARVAGKTQAVAVYELLALKGGLPAAKAEVVDLYAHALALYRDARFVDAAAPLERALKLDPTDGPARILLARCQGYLQNPPPMPFEAVANLDK